MININMKTYPTTLTLSESGKILILTAGNGRVIAEIFVEGPLSSAIYNAVNDVPFKKGIVNIFRGYLDPLEKDEFLNKENECIDRF